MLQQLTLLTQFAIIQPPRRRSLVQLKNGWRIDDIIYTKDNTTLKAVIDAIVDEAAHLKK
jgi:hypothetical protein